MSHWGGTDAALLKKGIDNILGDKGRVPLKDDQYKHEVIGCISDGASVNFGRNTGLMRRLAVNCPWLIKIPSQIIELNWQSKNRSRIPPSMNVTHFTSGILPS